MNRDRILARYRTLRVKVPFLEVTDAEVDADLQKIRDLNPVWVPLDRPATWGDYPLISVEGTRNGRPVEWGSARGWRYKLGEGSVTRPDQRIRAELLHLDRALDGCRAGDTVLFEAPAFDGRSALFTVDVEAVHELQPGRLDDQLAIDATGGDMTTLDELRALIRRRLEYRRKGEIRLAWQDGTLERLAGLVGSLDKEHTARAVEEQWRLLAPSAWERSHGIGRYLDARGITIEQLGDEVITGGIKTAKIAYALDLVANDIGLPAGFPTGTRRVGARDWLLGHVRLVDPAGRALDPALLAP